MASSIETGHAVIISNFKLLHDKCAAFGASYNPSNTDITVANLFALWQAADGQQTTLNAILSNAKIPINQRKLAFDPLDKLITRSYNALKATKADKEIKKDAKGLADKIRGTKVKNPNPLPTPPDDPANPNPDWVSNSHQSYVQKANFFEQYIDLLSAEPLYVPNETDLTTASMGALLTVLKQHNNDMGVNVVTPMEQGRIVRNNLLYAADTGLIDISLAVKAYVISLFGATNPQTKTVTGIKFKRPKM